MNSSVGQARGAGAPTKPAALTVGATIGDRYEVVGIIGSGGMGEVYEVLHLGLRKTFALKCLKESALSDERATERFVREIRSLAAVHSEFVVAINDCGQLANGSPFLVMERLAGRDLRKLLRDSVALSTPRALKLAIDACLGLNAIHEAGLVHRDLKPENLFVKRVSGESERCVVLDFGIAKVVGTGSTTPHSLLGTLKYMSPEQIADPASVGPASDIYSVGAILYEALAGRPPHVAETEPELMFQILHRDAPPLESLVPDADRAVCAVLRRCLHRSPASRFASALALAAALGSCLVAHGGAPEATTRFEHSQRNVHARPFRRRAALVGTASFIAGAALSLLVSTWKAPSPQPATASDPPSKEPPPSNEPPLSSPEQPRAQITNSAPPALSAKKRVPVRPSRTDRTDLRAPLPSLDDANPYE